MTFEGWAPEIGPYLSLGEVIEFSFDYRGNVTVVRRDGSRVAGYLFNRNASVPSPFVQLFDERGEGPITIAYADILTVEFTGKDAAAGNSWKAWVERRARDGGAGGASSPVGGRDGHPDPHGR
jgi:hypothetical protein